MSAVRFVNRRFLERTLAFFEPGGNVLAELLD